MPSPTVGLAQASAHLDARDLGGPNREAHEQNSGKRQQEGDADLDDAELGEPEHRSLRHASNDLAVQHSALPAAWENSHAIAEPFYAVAKHSVLRLGVARAEMSHEGTTLVGLPSRRAVAQR